uniref:PGG domain-containing protein n=1 Tax=Aegilops tauschii subsp. strangulata TaxID=200361 RepID=A0A453QG92_AEGTS
FIQTRNKRFLGREPRCLNGSRTCIPAFYSTGLLSLGLSIQQVSAEGNNVLHLAAEHGHDKLIHCLMSFGDRSLLSSRNSTLDTPLHCAARAGHGKAVSLLVQLSCEGGDDSTLWCKNEAGNTALHLAARLGHGASVEAIVSVAPGLAFEVNNTGVSVLYLAVMSGSLPTVRSITTRCGNASAAGLSSQNALHAAVFQGSEMVRLLLEWTPCGPSLASQADGTGSTPLHFASSTGDHLSVVGAILRAVPPCVVRMRDSGGLSALHVAAGMGHDRVAESLIKACPDAAELRDDHGGTFLHAAARGGHLKVVRLAIKKRTLRGLLNAQDGDGNTPLHLAVAAGAPAVAEALMGKGKVRDDIMNNDGQTPLDLAVRSTSFFSMVSLVATLAAFGAQSRPERRDRVQQWDGREITKAIEKTSDSLAVIAVLVASVAFTAANNLPGSYEQSGGERGHLQVLPHPGQLRPGDLRARGGAAPLRQGVALRRVMENLRGGVALPVAVPGEHGPGILRGPGRRHEHGGCPQHRLQHHTQCPFRAVGRGLALCQPSGVVPHAIQVPVAMWL